MEYYFEKGSKVAFISGGQESGGKGGICERFLANDSGHNEGGLSKAEFGKVFLIVAGGGDSENGNKGGNYEKKGEEDWGGRGSTNESAGKRDDINSENGRSDKGGDSSDKKEWYKYCGEGGDGFFCGGAGDYGDKVKDGEDEGGSNSGLQIYIKLVE